MKGLLLFFLVTLSFADLWSRTIIVKTNQELINAGKNALPGDLVLLANGEWKNVEIVITCKGTNASPITFRAQSENKVFITGESKLKIGGEYIIVQGLIFKSGYSGDEAVISFRSDKDHIANHCRVTKCAISNFNNPKRMDENNWVLFYGKNNRLDHCDFRDKKNMGVLLAVILDDDRSRENFHSIDHNYFGRRPPLASNGGEIIRVGVSQHCQFNSNTQIYANMFEYCDGETEIISIKSGWNRVNENVFKECQGSVVLRHGDNNTVDNNLFLGNGKEATGGVRIINKGQWVINNMFFRCRGLSFRSPLAIMNGIPNSPANRYVQVTDAVIANNTWYDCAPVSFGEGSDQERTLAPENVLLANNIFYTSKDTVIYQVYDKITGIDFANNAIRPETAGHTAQGFVPAKFMMSKTGNIIYTRSTNIEPAPLPDSLQQIALKRLMHPLNNQPGFSDVGLMNKILTSASGLKWYNEKLQTTVTKSVNCSNSDEIMNALKSGASIKINLTGSDYLINQPLPIKAHTEFYSTAKQAIYFRFNNAFALFHVKGGGTLKLSGLNFNFSKADIIKADFISTDSAGSSDHSNIIIERCEFNKMNNPGFAFLHCLKSTMTDSIIISDCRFIDNTNLLISAKDETEKKGYYNMEKLVLKNNKTINHTGPIMQLVRSGNDESTLGPKLLLTGNYFKDCHSSEKNGGPMIGLEGIQQTFLSHNNFNHCFLPNETLIRFEDTVRAVHLLHNNLIEHSGKLETNSFVINRDNVIKK